MGRVAIYSLFFGTQRNSKKRVGPLSRCIALMYQSFIKKTYNDALILRHGKSEIFNFTKAILQKADKEQIQKLITSNLIAVDLWKDEYVDLFDEYVDLFIEPEKDSLSNNEKKIDEIFLSLKAKIEKLEKRIDLLSKGSSAENNLSWVSSVELCKMLNISDSYLNTLIKKDPSFPAVIQISDKKRLFDKSAVNEWIESHKKNYED